MSTEPPDKRAPRTLLIEMNDDERIALEAGGDFFLRGYAQGLARFYVEPLRVVFTRDGKPVAETSVTKDDIDWADEASEGYE